MLIVELFITCWIVLMSDNSVFCYCDGESAPPPEEVVLVVETSRTKVEPPPAP